LGRHRGEGGEGGVGCEKRLPAILPRLPISCQNLASRYGQALFKERPPASVRCTNCPYLVPCAWSLCPLPLSIPLPSITNARIGVTSFEDPKGTLKRKKKLCLARRLRSKSLSQRCQFGTSCNADSQLASLVPYLRRQTWGRPSKQGTGTTGPERFYMRMPDIQYNRTSPWPMTKALFQQRLINTLHFSMWRGADSLKRYQSSTSTEM